MPPPRDPRKRSAVKVLDDAPPPPSDASTPRADPPRTDPPPAAKTKTTNAPSSEASSVTRSCLRFTLPDVARAESFARRAPRARPNAASFADEIARDTGCALHVLPRDASASPESHACAMILAGASSAPSACAAALDLCWTRLARDKLGHVHKDPTRAWLFLLVPRSQTDALRAPSPSSTAREGDPPAKKKKSGGRDASSEKEKLSPALRGALRASVSFVPGDARDDVRFAASALPTDRALVVTGSVGAVRGALAELAKALDHRVNPPSDDENPTRRFGVFFDGSGDRPNADPNAPSPSEPAKKQWGRVGNGYRGDATNAAGKRKPKTTSPLVDPPDARRGPDRPGSNKTAEERSHRRGDDRSRSRAEDPPDPAAASTHLRPRQRYAEKDDVTLTFEIATGDAGSLIGARGANISAIRKTAAVSALVHDPSPDTDETTRVVEIHGSAERCWHALDLCERRLELEGCRAKPDRVRMRDADGVVISRRARDRDRDGERRDGEHRDGDRRAAGGFAGGRDAPRPLPYGYDDRRRDDYAFDRRDGYEVPPHKKSRPYYSPNYYADEDRRGAPAGRGYSSRDYAGGVGPRAPHAWDGYAGYAARDPPGGGYGDGYGDGYGGDRRDRRDARGGSGPGFERPPPTGDPGGYPPGPLAQPPYDPSYAYGPGAPPPYSAPPPLAYPGAPDAYPGGGGPPPPEYIYRQQQHHHHHHPAGEAPPPFVPAEYYGAGAPSGYASYPGPGAGGYPLGGGPSAAGPSGGPPAPGFETQRFPENARRYDAYGEGPPPRGYGTD